MEISLTKSVWNVKNKENCGIFTGITEFGMLNYKKGLWNISSEDYRMFTHREDCVMSSLTEHWLMFIPTELCNIHTHNALWNIHHKENVD